MTAQSRPRYRGSDGNLYIPTYNPLEVFRGDDVNHSSKVGTAEEVYLPQADDVDHDIAIFKFKENPSSVTMDDVVSAYKAGRITQAEMDNLKPGDKLPMEAYVDAQPGNTGPSKRQPFDLHFIKQGIAVTATQKISVMWTSMKQNADRAICSYRASGASMVLPIIKRSSAGGITGISFKFSGPLVAFDDFRDAGNVAEYPNGFTGSQVRAARKAQYGIDVPNDDAICGTSTELPANPFIGKVVERPEEIPGWPDSVSVLAIP
jgi:hypothetical protein